MFTTKYTKKMLLLYSIVFLLLFNISYATSRYTLSICAIFRDEAPYLKEWIEFHRLVGVEHFYLCNHHSSDDYASVLQPYIDKGIVELFQSESNEETNNIFLFNSIQCDFYTKSVKRACGVSKWLACIDIDEFLFPAQENNLLTVLKKYQDCAGIAVNWQVFGTSWVQQILPGHLLIEELTRCHSYDASVNYHIKSIVRPKYVKEFLSPHYANYLEGYSQVNTDHTSFQGPFSPYVQVDVLRINHYWTKDEDHFYNVKLPRRVLWGLSNESMIANLDAMNVEQNTEILRFVPKLKKRLCK